MSEELPVPQNCGKRRISSGFGLTAVSVILNRSLRR